MKSPLKYKNKLKVDFVAEIQNRFGIKRSAYVNSTLPYIFDKLPMYKKDSDEIKVAVRLFFESLRDMILLGNTVSLSPLSNISVKKLKRILYIKGKYHVRV